MMGRVTPSRVASPPVFPFGQPVLPNQPSNRGQRDAFVLGAYPSGLHVAWQPPPGYRSLVRALIVDNEPMPFWDGSDVEHRTAKWLQDVGWDDSWGSIRCAPWHNGPSGKRLATHILEPLHLTRDQVCITDCLNSSRLNPGQATRVADTYTPAAEALNLPECTLEPVPAGEAGIVRESIEDHVDRLRAELAEAAPSVIVTLGNAALRIVAALVTAHDGHVPRRLTADGYGTPSTVRYDGRLIEWLPLVHPRNGERHRDWRETHARWLNKRTLTARPLRPA